MDLTEPNSGSDVGDILSAFPPTNRIYKIKGTKCFITGSGEYHRNIVHLVCPNREGTWYRGISLFVVPKQPTADGE